jgi:hypothetical protein
MIEETGALEAIVFLVFLVLLVLQVITSSASIVLSGS